MDQRQCNCPYAAAGVLDRAAHISKPPAGSTHSSVRCREEPWQALAPHSQLRQQRHATCCMLPLSVMQGTRSSCLPAGYLFVPASP